MGTSFVEFNGNGFWAHDASLEIWLETLVQEIYRWPSPSRWLTLVQGHWHLQAVGGFGGWISPDLDSFITTHEQRHLLIALSEQARRTLATYDQTVPRDILNELITDEAYGPPGRHFTVDVSSERFLAVGRAFTQLLKGEITTTPSTSPTIG